MLPLFAYIGGKARQAKWISGFVDDIATKQKCHCYIEPFCGAASVFFTKQKVKVEALNDTSRRLTSVFKALRDHPQEVVDFCQLIEYSQDAYYEAGEHWLKQGAWQLFFYTSVFGGASDTSKGFSQSSDRSHSDTWSHKLPRLWTYMTRLKDCVILNQDALKLIVRVDKPGVLLYCDPPYVPESEHGPKWANGFDHERFKDIILGLKHAKVIISHYHVEPYITWFKDFKVETKVSRKMGGHIRDFNDKATVTEALFIKG